MFFIALACRKALSNKDFAAGLIAFSSVLLSSRFSGA